MTKPKVPTYRRQKKPNGNHQAFVVLNGQRVYLGAWNTAESRERYRQVTAEWLARGQERPTDPATITIVELIRHYDRHAEDYYRRPDGTPTTETANLRLATRLLKDLYGRTAAAEFGPLQLKAVREAMVGKGWARRHCNKQVSRIRRIFRWGVEQGLIPGETWHALLAVTGLKRGRTEARETKPIKPVPDAIVDATLRHLPPTLQTMVELQRVTGMRPAEVCIMRTCDIDTTGAIWIYKPYRHKTDYLGREREVYIGPNGQKILKGWLKPDLQAYIFTPEQAEQERRDARHAKRVTRMSCGNVPGSHVNPDRSQPIGEVYDTHAYGRAIAYACDLELPLPKDLRLGKGETRTEWRERLGNRWREVLAWRREHRWAPNRLRHNYATMIRKSHGLAAAQVMLGHARCDVTETYAEIDRQQGLMLAAKIG